MQALLRFASKGVLLHKVLHGLGADPSPPLSHPFSHTQIVALLYYVLSYFPGGPDPSKVHLSGGVVAGRLFIDAGRMPGRIIPRGAF